MAWLLYPIVTAIAYVVCLVKLKGRTEQERIGSTPVFMNTLIFFAIYEWFFLAYIRLTLGWHLLGLLVSFGLAMSIYFYLKNLKKDIEEIFDKLVRQTQGKVSILTFMQRTELSQEEAMAFLEAKLDEFQGVSYETQGNIYYEFERW